MFIEIVGDGCILLFYNFEIEMDSDCLNINKLTLLVTQEDHITMLAYNDLIQG